MQLNLNHQAYLDTAFRDAIESYSHAYRDNQVPLPPELRTMVKKNCGWSEADQISDDLIASGGTNIWLDWKRSFRLTMLRQGMDPEQTDELKLNDLEPLDPLGSYSVQQDASTVAVTCESPHLTGSGETMHAAVEALYHQIRNEYFDDDYRPELDPRNWASPPEATPEQRATLRHLLTTLKLTDEQKPRFREAALAGKPLPKDIAGSFNRQRDELIGD
ncbi:MAG: hypothetical protein RL651_1463 [Pseudomonadota bacterium]|jgi:hypothetical protein